MDKQVKRMKRAGRARAKIVRSGAIRLVVHKTNRHIYVQLVDDGKVLASSSTGNKSIKGAVKNTGNIEAAKLVGKDIADRCANIGINKKIAFDRSGFSFHGRVKALADAARENGMKF